MLVNLPSVMKPRHCGDLIRIGSEYDGGYLVSLSDVVESNALLSFGLNDDWKFEKDFSKLNPVPCTVYDASVDVRFWIKRTFIDFFKQPFKFSPFGKLVDYFLFFRGQRRHIRRYVGFNSVDGSMIDFYSAFEALGVTSKLFVKCDIEGGEYRILDDILANSSNISGLVIEFHACDLFIEKIIKFIDDFPLNVVHVHVNSFSQVRSNDYLPSVIEVSFSSREVYGFIEHLPCALDRPNGRGMLEFEVNFVNG